MIKLKQLIKESLKDMVFSKSIKPKHKKRMNLKVTLFDENPKLTIKEPPANDSNKTRAEVFYLLSYNDGVIDKDDACPDIAGVKEKDGCPITDRDEDGINDENDSCPDEPGNSKNNGCPDNPAAIVEMINSLQILFNFSGDQPINQSDSFLNNLSELLKKYPYINLKIKGHASNEGPEQYNQVLSERRSANIKTVLESLGVESTRLKVVGEGENNPPFPNDSKENRTKNRTVLISIE